RVIHPCGKAPEHSHAKMIKLRFARYICHMLVMFWERINNVLDINPKIIQRNSACKMHRNYPFFNVSARKETSRQGSLSPAGRFVLLLSCFDQVNDFNAIFLGSLGKTHQRLKAVIDELVAQTMGHPGRTTHQHFRAACAGRFRKCDLDKALNALCNKISHRRALEEQKVSDFLEFFPIGKIFHAELLKLRGDPELGEVDNGHRFSPVELSESPP